MRGSVLEYPAFTTFMPNQQTQVKKASVEHATKPSDSFWQRAVDTQTQERRNRNILNELRKDADYWAKFLNDANSDIEDNPSVIDDLFTDQEQALSDLDHVTKVTENNLPVFIQMRKVANEGGRFETGQVIEKLIQSLHRLISASENFSWHVNVYEASKRPRTGVVCESAEEFKHALLG